MVSCLRKIAWNFLPRREPSELDWAHPTWVKLAISPTMPLQDIVRTRLNVEIKVLRGFEEDDKFGFGGIQTDTKNEAVRLMMFPISLIGEAKTWLDELNEGTIETWDELQTAFISRFFPPALFDQLLGEICAFSQHENESLTDAWLCMKEMLRNFHGHNLSKGNIIKIFYHGLSEIIQKVLNAEVDGIFLYETPNQAYQLLKDKVLLKLDWAKNQKTKSSLKKTISFADEGSSNSNNNKIMARMDVMTIKMDAQYKKLQSRTKQPTPYLDDDDMPMSREEEAKFMKHSARLVFTMITVTETRIAIIGVQADGMITTETTTDPIPMINLMIFRNNLTIS
nr:reverse transcriptase domain-containing protein [Tanacetum cinerariifolium]